MDWKYEVHNHTIKTDPGSMEELPGLLQHMVNEGRNSSGLELVTLTAIPRDDGDTELLMVFKAPRVPDPTIRVSAELLEKAVDL
ncbi:hypothetical protein [Candidatus Nitrospira bockiana]